MPESSHLAGLSLGPSDLANEKHYSIIEISKLWALSQKTVRRIFEREAGVIHWDRKSLATSVVIGHYVCLRPFYYASIENYDVQVESENS